MENKSTVAIYAGGAVVLLWLSSTIVSAVNGVPLVSILLMLIGSEIPPFPILIIIGQQLVVTWITMCSSS